MATADDKDLDGPWGDPEVYKDPPRWSGESYQGKHLSECDPTYLDDLASFYEWQAKRDDENNAKTPAGKPKAQYRYKDAARCRGWAARLRAGWKPAAAAAPEDASDDGEGDDFPPL